MTERKYVLTKLAPGDYILPGNDGRTIWRIARYHEDEWDDGAISVVRTIEVWGCWKWTGSNEDLPYSDFDDWGRWDFWEGWARTREDAIQAALRPDR